MPRPSPFSDPRGWDADRFLRSLAQIPWFGALGEPDPDDRVGRIRSWEEWPGPEATEDFALRMQSWHDRLVLAAGDRKPELESWFGRAREAVFEHARDAVPYDPEEDAWHGPTSAVWHAAFLAGIIAGALALGCAIPTEALDQWRWYAAGHWPCGYARAPEDGESGILLVL